MFVVAASARTEQAILRGKLLAWEWAHRFYAQHLILPVAQRWRALAPQAR